MATRFELVMHGENLASLQAAGEEALAEVTRLENLLSLYRPGSEIAQINFRAASAAVQVSPEVFALLERALKLSAETEGAFDVTIAPLVRCWGFMGAGGRMPTAEEIAVARAVVGWDKVALDAQNRTVRFRQPGMMLDLGAIGKGYAVASGVEILREAGVTSALFHGGTSTVGAIGHPPDAAVWKVAVAVPGQNDQLRQEFYLRDSALSVSAVWGRMFQSEDKRFGHVIDPRSGQPVSETILAAVELPDATETDALSTALLTLGATGLAKIAALRPAAKLFQMTANGRCCFWPKSTP